MPIFRVKSVKIARKIYTDGIGRVGDNYLVCLQLVCTDWTFTKRCSTSMLPKLPIYRHFVPVCIFSLLCACTYFFSAKCCSGTTATPTDLKRGSKWFGRDHAKVEDSNYSRSGLHNLLHLCI